MNENSAPLPGRESRPLVKPARWSPKRVEDTFLIAVVSIGFLLPFLVFVFHWGARFPPVFSAAWLAAAVSALVYRFLGGIDANTKVVMMRAQLGGTMAAFAFCTYFFDSRIDTYFHPAAEYRPLLLPASTKVSIEGQDIELLDVSSLRKRDLHRSLQGLLDHLAKATATAGITDETRRQDRETALLRQFGERVSVALAIDEKDRKNLQSAILNYAADHRREADLDEAWEEVVDGLFVRARREVDEESDEPRPGTTAEGGAATPNPHVRSFSDRDLQEAFRTYPFAIYKVGADVGVAFPGDSIRLGDQSYAVPVFANPMKEKTQRLGAKVAMEAIVLQLQTR